MFLKPLLNNVFILKQQIRLLFLFLMLLTKFDKKRCDKTAGCGHVIKSHLNKKCFCWSTHGELSSFLFLYFKKLMFTASDWWKHEVFLDDYQGVYDHVFLFSVQKMSVPGDLSSFLFLYFKKVMFTVAEQ